jgi:hypothetical protein
MHTVGMKFARYFATCLPFLFFPAHAQDASDSGQLKGLTGVKVLVALDDTFSAKADLAKKDLQANRLTIQTDVELRLRAAGMRVLAVDGEANAILQVRVTQYYESTSTDLELYERVVLKRNPGVEVRAVTWRRSGLGQGSNVQNLRDFVKDLVDQFLNSWFAANPKQR